MKNTHTLTVVVGPSWPAKQTVKMVKQVWIESQREMLKEAISKMLSCLWRTLECVLRYLAKEMVAEQAQQRRRTLAQEPGGLLRESGLSLLSFSLKFYAV